MYYKGKTCIGVMIKEGRGFGPSEWESCGNPPGPRNPHWCDECDKKRIAGISKSFDEISKGFDELSRGYEGRT